MPLCTRCCQERAVIRLKFPDISLCRKCFLGYFEKLVLHALKDAEVLERLPGKLVVVATSGGKDSSNALFVMKKLSDYYGFEVIALLIDEGIKGYRDLKAKALSRLCTQLKVKLEKVSLKDRMGISIDEAASLNLRGKIRLKPCSICGVYRRYLINLTAKELGASFVVTGHNLDDEVQTFVMNMIRGDIQSVAREGIVSEALLGDLVPRVKPLYYIYEKESLVYFLINKLHTPYVECPYASLSMRYYIRSMLNELERLKPGTKWHLLILKERIREIISSRTSPPTLSKCSLCGMPASHELCRACQIKLQLKRILEN